MGKQAIDNVIRLHGYQASVEDINNLCNCEEEPIVGFLTADDNRSSYGLNTEDNRYIYSHDELIINDVIYISTDFRMEYILDTRGKIEELNTGVWNNQLHDLVIFTHERMLDSGLIKKRIAAFCNYAKYNGYQMSYFEDNVKTFSGNRF